MFAYIHKECGKPAIYLTRMPASDERVDTKIMRHVDGTPVESGELKICGSCGALMSGRVNIRNIKEVN